MVKEPIKKIGIYFKPLLILPFSTVETISEEKNDITTKDNIENILKLLGSTETWVIVKGKVPTVLVAAATRDTKPRITIKRWNDKEKSKGAITITIAPIKIV